VQAEVSRLTLTSWTHCQVPESFMAAVCGYVSCMSPQLVPLLENMWWLFQKMVSASWSIHADTDLLKTPSAGVINSCCCWICSVYLRVQCRLQWIWNEHFRKHSMETEMSMLTLTSWTHLTK
jgi:hypothetical protein